MVLAFLVFPFVEMYLLYKFVEAYSFVDLVLYLLSTGILGMAIMKLQGKNTFTQMQMQIIQGKLPNDRALHGAFVLLGGLLLFIPGFVSDIFGVLCIFPISRHLLIMYFKNSIKKGLFKGRVQVFGNGTSFGGGFGGFQQSHSTRETYQERDAQVIDIEPISITHEDKKNDTP